MQNTKKENNHSLNNATIVTSVGQTSIGCQAPGPLTQWPPEVSCHVILVHIQPYLEREPSQFSWLSTQGGS